MENASTALIIAASMFIAMLIIGLIAYSFNTVSDFAQKQVTAEEVSEIIQFNQPFIELHAKANYGVHDQFLIGAIAEDIISAINYAKHVNQTTIHRVEFIFVFEKKAMTLDQITPKVQQDFIHKDLEARETSDDTNRLRYSCELGYADNSATSRVNYVKVEVK